MLLASGASMTLRSMLLLASLALMSCGLLDDVEDADCATVLCAPCESPLAVTLGVPAGQPPPEAILEGVGGQCAAQEGKTVCLIDPRSAGTYEFDIQATGYQKAHVREQVLEKKRSSCCSCPYFSRTVDVQLTPQ